MEAKAGPDKSGPDLIQHDRPVADALAVKSRIENLVSQIVEPYLEGVRLEPVFEVPGEKRGFVLVVVPATEGFPCRSRKDWKDYQRISAGAMPMEYFQIADMFGKRRRPVLKLHLDAGDITRMGEISDRTFVVAIENCGRGIAKFPSNRFSRMPGIRCWRMWARW